MSEPLRARVTRAGTDDRAAADAFRAFIEAQLADAYRLATYVLGGAEDGADAVHDAAISAWRHWDDRRHPDRSTAWFRRIVVNACHDRLRARSRVRSITVGLDMPVRHPSVADAADAVAASDALERLVATLPFDDRALVAMRFGLDLTIPAIAEALGIPDGTVKSRLSRALSALRAAVEEPGP